MSSLIYIIAVILFAIVTNVNKAKKNKDKGNPPSGMPTFGGGGDQPLRRNLRRVGGQDSERSGLPAPAADGGSGRTPFEEGRDTVSPPVWAQRSPSPDMETGEGVSYEHRQEEDGVEARIQSMKAEVERVNAAFDQVAGADPVLLHQDQGKPSGSAGRRALAGDRESLRNGLIWAEVLGPPRSRQSHFSRRQG
ncbi:hypothetical protein GCM10010912_24170 [Paenibacillus albidus]|uniref:Uncharacterized protein n=1 Tax=Paenibacillus albidus TaxID=2041023 RepID=A0A917FHE1_9BACL|nr:hypothetical protein [Paenibacillus albidus]GGF78290.1 hypothetical protein GCM10010912_24170 [Paenibacillus albidus]